MSVSDMAVLEVADGIFRLVLPLGIHGIPSVNGYLLVDDDGDTVVDCGIALDDPDAGDQNDGTAPLLAALAECGSSFERLRRVVITHAHIDHFGVAGEVVRRSDADLWMHTETTRDLAKYDDPDSAVDRRATMLADHGLDGEELEGASTVLHDWMPVMPSIGRPTTLVNGGESFTAAGREWRVVPTPGHSPGHICLWAETDKYLCSGDHLLKNISPPVTFERGMERDPMGSYLQSLHTVQRLAPTLVLPGHGDTFKDGAARAAVIEKKKHQHIDRLLGLLQGAEKTVADVTVELFGPQPTASRLHFAMAEVLAYLAYFENRALARRTRDPDGVYTWRAL